MFMPRHSIAIRRAAVRTLVVACGVSSLACGDPTSERDGKLAQSVIKGTASPVEQNAIVLVRDTATGEWGTGSLVAPNLVLTSKRVLFTDTLDYAKFYCAEGGAGVPVTKAAQADDIDVLFGAEFPLDTATGVRIYAGTELDVCRNDIALLEIDSAFPITPLPLRFFTAPLEGEHGILVGWGMSEISRDSPPGSTMTPTGRRHQTALEIRVVSDDPSPPPGEEPFPDTTFTTDVGACYGDTGAPFISDDTGAIIGTLSRFEPARLTVGGTASPLDCDRGRPVFRALSADRRWLTEAFHEAGAAPWLEGFSRPSAVGAACGTDEECESRHCLQSRSGGFCSASCSQDPCSGATLCLSIDGEPWCVPERLGDESAESAACNVSSFSSKHHDWTSILILTLIFAYNRSRRSWRSNAATQHR